MLLLCLLLRRRSTPTTQCRSCRHGGHGSDGNCVFHVPTAAIAFAMIVVVIVGAQGSLPLSWHHLLLPLFTASFVASPHHTLLLVFPQLQRMISAMTYLQPHHTHSTCLTPTPLWISAPAFGCCLYSVSVSRMAISLRNDNIIMHHLRRGKLQTSA